MAISWQLNAARYLCGVHELCPLLREEIVPVVRVVNSRGVCTSLVPRPMIVVFGLGTRLHIRMRTKLENGVLRNGGCERLFEAMKTLNGRRAPRCDKHQFCGKMTVCTQTVFEIQLLNLKTHTFVTAHFYV